MKNPGMRAAFALALAALLLQGGVLAAVLSGRAPPGQKGAIVAVSGTGSARARPDTMSMTISLSRTADTTREAQAQVSGMAARALEVLRAAGVEDRSVATASLRFSPEYEWLQQGGRRLVGQRAEQIVSFSVEDIHGANEGAASLIIDGLAGIEGLELLSTAFSVRDPEALLREAREAAFADALAKASQYAALAGQRIVRAVAIAEDGAAMPAARAGMRMEAAASLSASPSPVLPAGEAEATARVTAEFLMR